ncbi:DUF2846 domain-containing protein [Solimonas sp. K1W22B-7]|nr:DUF2846 domain-containing protein [Solimonas sp. K1W22B-7]
MGLRQNAKHLKQMLPPTPPFPGKNPKMMRSCLLALVLLLTACASAKGPQYRSGPAAQIDESIIYVYRPWALPAGGYTARLQMDGMAPKNLKNASYISFRVLPGRHSLRTVKKGFQDWGGKVQEISLDTLGGQVYFIKYDVTGSAMATGGTPPVVVSSSLDMRLVPNYSAEAEMQELRESD